MIENRPHDYGPDGYNPQKAGEYPSRQPEGSGDAAYGDPRDAGLIESGGGLHLDPGLYYNRNRAAGDEPSPQQPEDISDTEMRALLHEEQNRLPNRARRFIRGAGEAALSTLGTIREKLTPSTKPEEANNDPLAPRPIYDKETGNIIGRVDNQGRQL